MKEKNVVFVVVAVPDAPAAPARPARRTREGGAPAAPLVPVVYDTQAPPRVPREKKPRRVKPEPPRSKRPLWHLAIHRFDPPRSTGHYFARQSDAFVALFSLVAWVPSDVGLVIAIDPVRGGPRFVAERRAGEWGRTE